MAGEHAGHRQRMRERFRENGLSGFAEHEVIELLLFYAIPQRDVNLLAHQLVDRFGSLHGVLDASCEELEQVEGIGANAATLLSLFSHVARLLERSRGRELEALKTRKEAKDYCRRLLNGLKQEHFYAICLNGQMQVLRCELIAKGTLSEVQAYPRLVMEAVLRHNAHAVLLCHNHPGAQIAPSQADVDTTQLLAHVLASVGVLLADHIVVCGAQALSMVEEGLLEYRAAANDVARAATSAGQTRIAGQLKKNKEEKACKSGSLES